MQKSGSLQIAQKAAENCHGPGFFLRSRSSQRAAGFEICFYASMSQRCVEQPEGGRPQSDPEKAAHLRHRETLW
jgi:hypothetical protein